MPTNAPELAPEHAWFKSSYSDPGQNCVEATHLAAAPGIAVRDSKNPTGPALRLSPITWAAFVTRLCESPATRA